MSIAVILIKIRTRLPFPLLGIHPDNGTNLINALLYNYTIEERIEFTRSRAYKKNDNCFVEQKNSTHVRQVIGYLRYDTEEEMNLINDIYQNELRLFKNFFHKKKRDSQTVDKHKKQVPFTVSKYMSNKKNYGVLVK